MAETTTFTVDGMKFQPVLLPALEAGALDIQVCALIAPILKSLTGLSLDAEIDPEVLFDSVTQALQSLTKEKFALLMVETLSNTSYVTTNKSPQRLTEEGINTIFQGKLVSLYKTFYEVIKFNKFLPFEFVGVGGIEMKTILTSFSPTKKVKTSGKESAKSENLLDD